MHYNLLGYMAEHNVLGAKGEDRAADLLREKGYTIRHTNWRQGRYELDIVAELGDTLAVVEVKTRSANSLTGPEEAVDKKKIRRVVSAADKYVRKFDLSLFVRFDIITVVGNRMEHIEDAFYPPLL